MASFLQNLAAALAILGSTASAHLILNNPVPYGKDTINNSPLTSSNFPCQVSSDASSFYSTDGISNSVTAGESIKMSFTGSAVHEGGSCQVALSTDMQPSKTTRWSVILSIEGGCPSKEGSSADSYDVTIPSDVPAGTYSYAWTWTSKLSGTQEYYMNCAPITVKAASGSKARSQNIRVRSDALDSYPPLAVYNLAELNSCKSVLSSDPTYAFPGDNVEHDATGSNTYTPKAITGSDCFAKGVTYSGSSSGGSDSSSDSGSSSSAAASSATSAPSATGGGVFATSAAASAAAPTVTGSGSSSGSSGSGSSGSETTSASSSSSTGSASSGSSSSSGSCTAGDYECDSSGTSYKMCVAGGEWSTSMSVASGTTCTPGTSTSLNIAATASKAKKWRFFRY